MLKDFFEHTAWKMNVPKPYGLFHLFFFFFGIALCVFFAYRLRNSSKRQNKIIFFSVGIFLLITELYKQLFYFFVIGKGSYQWWIFPF